MKLFSKSPKKSRKTSTSDEESHSPRSRSPLKKSMSSKSGKARDENYKHAEQGSARSSRSYQLDANSHPLNLPPEQLRRLSALSTMSDPMDIDIDAQDGVPTSPPPPSNVPGSFDTPKTNGTNGTVNGEGPVPPPHKSNPTSPATPVAPTPEDAEAFKTAGNKFYKAKEYNKAIVEYTKGMNFPFNTNSLMTANIYSQKPSKHNPCPPHTSTTARQHIFQPDNIAKPWRILYELMSSTHKTRRSSSD